MAGGGKPCPNMLAGFGEANSSYVVTGTKTDEFDFPLGDRRPKHTSPFGLNVLIVSHTISIQS